MGACGSIHAVSSSAHAPVPADLHASGQSVLPGKVKLDPVRNFYAFDKEPLHRGSRWTLHGVTHLASGQRFVCKTIRKAKLASSDELHHLQNEILVHRKLSVCRLSSLNASNATTTAVTTGVLSHKSSGTLTPTSSPSSPVRFLAATPTVRDCSCTLASAETAAAAAAAAALPLTSSCPSTPTRQQQQQSCSCSNSSHSQEEEQDRPSAHTMHLQQGLGAHPNIAGIFETYEDSMHAHVILEECTGCDLFERIKRDRALSEAVAAAAMADILAVVSHCHAGGVVHRGIQPEAFMYADSSPGSSLKAIDFGTATFVQDVGDEVVGSPLYVAPEMLRGKYGVEADLWSCGVLLYVLLAGYAPFEGDSTLDIFEQAVSAPLNLKSHPWPDISPAAKDLVSRLLVRDPKRRLTAKHALRHQWFQEQANTTAIITLGLSASKPA